jgi:hypothetical protein
MEHPTTTRVCNKKDESSVKIGEPGPLAFLQLSLRLCTCLLPLLARLSAPQKKEEEEKGEESRLSARTANAHYLHSRSACLLSPLSPLPAITLLLSSALCLLATSELLCYT